MKTVYEDRIGQEDRADEGRLADWANIPDALQAALDSQFSNLRLSPAQRSALEAGIVEKAVKHFLVCAPTNSGKTLVAVLRMFTLAMRDGVRSVFVAPLKALAEEKQDEFSLLAEEIAKNGGPKIRVKITTGDYQLSEDFLGSPPPEDGEIIICTPERLEVLMRNPETTKWASSVGCFVFDEFHLLADRHRGPVVETLTTRILVSCPWSSLVALSATIGKPEQIQKWWTSVSHETVVIDDLYRYPPLCRCIRVSDDSDLATKNWAESVLGAPRRNGLVFVARRLDAEKLSKQLNGIRSPNSPINSFHAGLSREERIRRSKDFRNSTLRILVCTTSLKMGVDLPVTDVLIRDPFVASDRGRRHLGTSDLLQMLGRAGRRDVEGEGTILARSEEDAATFSKMIQATPESLEPRLFPKFTAKFRRTRPTVPDPVMGVVLAEVAAKERSTATDIYDFLAKSFSAIANGLDSAAIKTALANLVRLKMVYLEPESDGLYVATKLGRVTTQCGISPESSAIVAGMLRALINLGEKEAEKNGQDRIDLIASLTQLDLLALVLAVHECRSGWVVKSRKANKEMIQEFVEELPYDQKPLFYRWRSPTCGDFPTRRLFSTLQFEHDPADELKTGRLFFQWFSNAVVLLRHSSGETSKDLCKEFRCSEGDFENRMKLSAVWVLSCLSQICNPKKAYNMNSVRQKSLGLIDRVSVGAPIGTLLQFKGIGRRTLEKLVAAGVTTWPQLLALKRSNLESMSLSSKQIQILKTEARKRTR